jgi:hypothetical protein
MAPVTAPATMAKARKMVPAMVQVRTGSCWPVSFKDAD